MTLAYDLLWIYPLIVFCWCVIGLVFWLVRKKREKYIEIEEDDDYSPNPEYEKLVRRMGKRGIIFDECSVIDWDETETELWIQIDGRVTFPK